MFSVIGRKISVFGEKASRISAQEKGEALDCVIRASWSILRSLAKVPFRCKKGCRREIFPLAATAKEKAANDQRGRQGRPSRERKTSFWNLQSAPRGGRYQKIGGEGSHTNELTAGKNGAEEVSRTQKRIG